MGLAPMHPAGCSGRVVDSKFPTTAVHPWTEGNAHRPTPQAQPA